MANAQWFFFTKSSLNTSNDKEKEQNQIQHNTRKRLMTISVLREDYKGQKPEPISANFDPNQKIFVS